MQEDIERHAQAYKLSDGVTIKGWPFNQPLHAIRNGFGCITVTRGGGQCGFTLSYEEVEAAYQLITNLSMQGYGRGT